MDSERVLRNADPTDARRSGADGLETAEPTEGITDDELLDLLQGQQTDIAVVGCGGGGCNTVGRLHREGGHAADLVAMNTDVQHLTQVAADAKLLLGKEETGGKGTGSLPHVGERAALAAREDIVMAVEDRDMVFVTAGLGGGTGTGAAPVVAKAARAAGALTVAIVTMPFTAEGEARRANAAAGLERLRTVADTVIVIPNDRLVETVGDLPVREAFKVADEVLMRAVTGITDLVTRSGMVNLDFADVETVLGSGGVAMIGFGESESDDKARDAVRSAVESPLLDVDLEGATAALVNVTGGPGMTIDEAEGVVEEVYDRVDPSARIIWGTGIDRSLGETLRTMVVITGVTSPQMYGRRPAPDATS